MQRLEIDCSTGEAKEIALSDDEIKLLEIEWDKNSKAIAAELAVPDKSAILAKLGITADEAKLLLS